MIFWGSWIFCMPNLPRFFFGLEKKHHHREIPVSGGQQNAGSGSQQATLCTQAELWDKMDRETKPTEGGGSEWSPCCKGLNSPKLVGVGWIMLEIKH